MNKEQAKLAVQEAVEKQEKELTKAELRKLAKKATKKEEDEKKFMNSMITRAEALQLINKFSAEAAQSIGEMLREPIRTNLIASMALADILKEKGIITEEEHILSMNKIAEDMNASLESLVEDGEEDGQGEEGTDDNQEA